ncbi:MAG: phosphatidate cytidylyltransferase [Crocinitomicaceae bacterium]|nr:phosphatidate cytidylyltransferase [Crocinitomicaceae bacterium]
MTRALTGAVYVTVVVLAIYFGGLALHLLFGIISALMLYEYCQLFRHTEYAPHPIITTAYGLLVYVAGLMVTNVLDSPKLNIYLMILLFLVLTSFIWFGLSELMRKTTKPIANVALSVSGIIYIVPSMLLINVFSKLGPQEVNVFPLLGIFIMIWAYDTFAYLIGRKFGKNKMAEQLSPNKSWEGFFGGVVFAVIAGAVIAYFQKDQPYFAYMLLGLVAASFGMLGDLFESMIKRQLELKDSGSILPGHGGLLDRFDSVLFVMPVSFFIVVLFTFYLS